MQLELELGEAQSLRRVEVEDEVVERGRIVGSLDPSRALRGRD
jgi:hypothetical protein